MFHMTFCMIVFSTIVIFTRFLPNRGIFYSLSLYSELLKDFLLYVSMWASRQNEIAHGTVLCIPLQNYKQVIAVFLKCWFVDVCAGNKLYFYPNGNGFSFLVIAVQFLQGIFELYFNTRVVQKTSLFQRQMCMLFFLSNCHVVFCNSSLLKRKCMDKNSNGRTEMRPFIFMLQNTQPFELGGIGKV